MKIPIILLSTLILAVCGCGSMIAMRPVLIEKTVVGGDTYAVSRKSDSKIIANMIKNTNGYFEITLGVLNICGKTINVAPRNIKLLCTYNGQYGSKKFTDELKVYSPSEWVKKTADQKAWATVLMRFTPEARPEKDYIDGHWVQATSLMYNSVQEQKKGYKPVLLADNTLSPDQYVTGTVYADYKEGLEYSLIFMINGEEHKIDFKPVK